MILSSLTMASEMPGMPNSLRFSSSDFSIAASCGGVIRGRRCSRLLGYQRLWAATARERATLSTSARKREISFMVGVLRGEGRQSLTTDYTDIIRFHTCNLWLGFTQRPRCRRY